MDSIVGNIGWRWISGPIHNGHIPTGGAPELENTDASTQTATFTCCRMPSSPEAVIYSTCKVNDW
jgi:hypothetical protein